MISDGEIFSSNDIDVADAGAIAGSDAITQRAKRTRGIAREQLSKELLRCAYERAEHAVPEKPVGALRNHLMPWSQ